MSEVSISEVRTIPLLAVTVGDQEPIFLNTDSAAALYDQLTAIVSPDGEELRWTAQAYDEAWEAGRAAATFPRPTVWFDYGNLGNPRERRNVVPITIKAGLEGVLLVGFELSKGGVTHDVPKVKSYRVHTITDLEEGHDVTWKVEDA